MEVDTSLINDSSSLKKKRDSKTACAVCRKSHVFCDGDRPCSRCVSKKITSECVEPVFKKRGRVPKGERVEIVTHPLLLPQVVYSTSSDQSSPQTDSSTDDLLFTEDEILKICSGSFDFTIEDSPNLSPEEMLEWNRIKQSPHFRHLFKKEDQIQSPANYIITETYTEDTKYPPTKETNTHKKMRSYIDNEVEPKQREELQKMTKKEALESFLLFENNLIKLGSVFDMLEAPTAIFEKNGIIHYVNQTFRILTGFEDSVPTSVDGQLFLQFLSPETFSSFAVKTFSLFASGELSSWMMPAEFRCYGKFVDVTMSINGVNNHKGECLMLIASIQPILPEFTLIKQLPTTMKQLGFRKLFANDEKKEEKTEEKANETNRESKDN